MKCYKKNTTTKITPKFETEKKEDFKVIAHNL